jgi:hypothetical protein
MKRNIFILLIFISTFLTGCKNYYNDTIDWTDSIKIGSDIQTVKRSQPDFVEILWDKPLKIDNEKLYEIVKIKGNYDILKMQNFLIFVDGKYQGRESFK